MGLFSFIKNMFGNKPKDESTKTYEQGLSKSRKAFASRLDALSKRYGKVNAEYFEELEEILIEADVGVELSIRLCEQLIEKSRKEGLTDPKEINDALVDLMFVDYATKGASIVNSIAFASSGPTVLLVVGVNGVGKTTSIAKLAYRYPVYILPNGELLSTPLPRVTRRKCKWRQLSPMSGLSHPLLFFGR